MSSFWKRFGPHAQIMRAVALEYPSLLKRLADAPDKTFHVYAMRLEALLKAEAGMAPRTIGEILDGADLAEHLTQAWGAAPVGAPAVLDRCGPDVQTASFYDRVRRIMLDPRLAAVLRRDKTVVSEMKLTRIEELAGLVPALDDVATAVPKDSLKALDWLLRRLGDAGIHPDEKWLRRKLKAMTADEWWKPIGDVMLQHPRVPAPWPGDDKLTPIETPRDLKRAGLRMKCCLGEGRYALGLIRERSAFYAWHGDEPAAIQIVLDAGGHWRIEDMNGIDNARLKRKTEREIERRFLAAGILPENDYIERLVYRFAAEN